MIKFNTNVFKQSWIFMVHVLCCIRRIIAILRWTHFELHLTYVPMFKQIWAFSASLLCENLYNRKYSFEIKLTMFYRSLLHFLKFWNVKYGKALKSNALSSGPWCQIWLPISICLDLSASSAIFECLTSYVSVLMLLMRGFSLKYT